MGRPSKNIDFNVFLLPEDHEKWDAQTRLETLAKLFIKAEQSTNNYEVHSDLESQEVGQEGFR